MNEDFDLSNFDTVQVELTIFGTTSPTGKSKIKVKGFLKRITPFLNTYGGANNICNFKVLVKTPGFYQRHKRFSRLCVYEHDENSINTTRMVLTEKAVLNRKFYQ